MSFAITAAVVAVVAVGTAVYAGVEQAEMEKKKSQAEEAARQQAALNAKRQEQEALNQQIMLRKETEKLKPGEFIPGDPINPNQQRGSSGTF